MESKKQNLEKKYINDIEKAIIAAEAEKPLRFIAREENLNLTAKEKKTLDSIAEKRGEVAMKEYERNEKITETTTETSEEEIRPKLVEKVFDLIKKSPNIKFAVMGIGNVLGKHGGSTIGGENYAFNSETQTMINDNDAMNLDINPRAKSPDTLFVPQWDIRLINNKRYVTRRLPIRPNDKNPYLNDIRGGVHITLAIGVPYLNDKIISLGDKELDERMNNPTEEFFGELMDKCAKEFIPGYYNYVLGLLGEK